MNRAEGDCMVPSLEATVQDSSTLLAPRKAGPPARSDLQEASGLMPSKQPLGSCQPLCNCRAVSGAHSRLPALRWGLTLLLIFKTGMYA